MISISAFIISLFGIISLLYFRLWEMKRSERLFSVERRKLDEKIVSFGKYIKEKIPTFDRSIVLRVYHITVHYFALIMLWIIKVIERRMVNLLEYVRGKREIKEIVTQSDFLKQVGDHKRNLENPSKSTLE